MPTDSADANKAGLHKEKNQPGGEDGGVDPDDQRPWDRSLHQVLQDCEVKTIDGNRRDEYCHGEVEVFVNEAVAAGEPESERPGELLRI